MPDRRAQLAGFLVLVAALAAPAAVAAVVEIPVQEDTWIDGLSSGSSNGSDTGLGICPVAEYWMYYKFDLSPVSGEVTGAELRLTRFNGGRPEEISIYHVTDDSWTEAALTGLNRPDPVNPPNSASLGRGEIAVGYDRWTSPQLAGAVFDDATGDGVTSLMLREDPDTAFDVRFYRSREAAVPDSSKPRLFVTCVQGEVPDLEASSSAPTTFTWAAAGDSVYDVVRGALSDLHADDGVSGATCADNDLPTPEFTDTDEDPPPGAGRYYLVRSSGGCGLGTYGESPGGGDRTPLADCP